MVAQKKNCYWNTGDPVTLDPVCKITYWIQLFLEVTESSTLVSLDLHICHLKCGFNGNFGFRLIL